MSAIELLPPGEATPDNPRWHELRRDGITASEIAAVMGISPWESPFSLYWRKVNGWQIDDSEIMATGVRLEPVIADWWTVEHPYYVICPAGLYAHPDRPWQLATPDRIVCDPQWHDNPFPGQPDYHYDHHQDAHHVAALECKWVAYSWDGWGEQGTDQIPVHYRAQCLWQADVMDVDEVHVAALGPGGFRAYRVQRDENDLALMRKAGEEFHRRLVDGDPPPLDSHTATLTTLKRLHPSVGEGDIEVPGTLAFGYSAARAKRKDAEDSIARSEAEIRAALGSTYARAVWDGRLVASRSVYERQGIDTARLRKERPDVAADYTTTTTVDRLNPGRNPSHDPDRQ